MDDFGRTVFPAGHFPIEADEFFHVGEAAHDLGRVTIVIVCRKKCENRRTAHVVELSNPGLRANLIT